MPLTIGSSEGFKYECRNNGIACQNCHIETAIPLPLVHMNDHGSDNLLVSRDYGCEAEQSVEADRCFDPPKT